MNKGEKYSYYLFINNKKQNNYEKAIICSCLSCRSNQFYWM